MTKQELSSLLKSLEVPVNEGITSDKNTNEYPRIVFWPYLEEDEMASGNEYQNVVTYQISFFARTPQHDKYKRVTEEVARTGDSP